MVHTQLHNFISLIVLMVATPAMAELIYPVGEFQQQYQIRYGTEDGLPDEQVLRVEFDGSVYVQTSGSGSFAFDGERWNSCDPSLVRNFYPVFDNYIPSTATLDEVLRKPAYYKDEIALPTLDGLYVGSQEKGELVYPRDGDVRWAPIDVRATVYDDEGHLWFACPQGVGYRVSRDKWKLFTGADGLPFNDFTCIAAGPSGLWFGTTNGVIQYYKNEFRFRQGGRWLLDNYVNDIAVDADGDAWIATAKGVSRIAHKTWTLAEKAKFYEEEIEKYHRRTKFGYVNPATLSTPGDKSTAKARYSDNDGFNTGLFLAAMSFAYTTTGDEKYRDHAHNSFRALAFLSVVTQGGEHGAPKGFIARNVVPTTEPDPNERYDFEYDVRRRERDGLWKVMKPRVPTDKTGEWYWKCDSSSDELDGHFLEARFTMISSVKRKKRKLKCGRSSGALSITLSSTTITLSITMVGLHAGAVSRRKT